MKKHRLLILLLAMVMVLSSCSLLPPSDPDEEDKAEVSETEEESEYADSVQKAMRKLKRAWKQEANEHPDFMSEPFVEIKNTRIVRIKDDPVNVQNENEPVPEMEDVDYIIEFMIYSNYLGDTYPRNINRLDSVAVYKNGTMEVMDMNILNGMASKYFITDFSGIIDEIIDLEDAFNGELFAEE